MGRKTHGPYLLAAIEHNDIKKINEILNSQIRSKTKVKEFLVSDVRRMASEFSEVPLLLAACNEDPRIIRLFVSNHGANINHVHEEGFGRKKKRKTALIEAVRRGLYDTVDTILALNADANEQDHKGRTALHHAVRKADFRMVKMLCARGAQVNITDKASNTPLHMATIFGHMELVKVLIKYGGDLYKKGQHGAIPIHIAAREGHSSLVRLFTQYEVNVNIKVPCYEGQERAPIHVAAEEGHAETVFSLLDSCGADVALRDSEGETPLHCCVIREYDPLGMKSKEDYTETVKVLLNFGAQVNLQNRRGETPMHLAARNEFQKIVEVLVVAGADPLIEDFDGNKPLDLVFPDDTVTRQILKNAHEEREKYMSEAIEIRARGFTTSIPKPLPLSMRSQSTMNVLGGSYMGTLNNSMGRAISVPGLLASNNPVYEDGYLAPLSARNNVGPGHAYSQTNTYKSSQSRSTGSSSSSHVQQSAPQPNPAPTYALIDDSLPQIAQGPPERRVSESNQFEQRRQPEPLSQRKRTQSADALNSQDSPYLNRSLPSPPAQRKASEQPRSRDVRESIQSEATSFWSVSTPDLKDEPSSRAGLGPPRQAGINKRQAAPLRFIPVGPHGAPDDNDQSDEDSYFDDESFETLDSYEESTNTREQMVIEANKKHQEMYGKKSGSQASLHEWLQEQAEYAKDRGPTNDAGPVAQSTPPQIRAAKPRDMGRMDDSVSEASIVRPGSHHPPVPPKPKDRKKSTDALESRRAPPPVPAKPAHAVNTSHGEINKVISVEVDDVGNPGHTIIRVVPQTPTSGLSENEESDDVPVIPPRKVEKPKVGKKPKMKSFEDADGGSEKGSTKPGKKTKKKKSQPKKKSVPGPRDVDLEGNEIYDAIKDSDISRYSEEAFQPQASSSSTEEKVPPRVEVQRPVPMKRGQPPARNVEEEQEAPPPTRQKKPSLAEKRQQLFQEQLALEKEQQAQLNQQKEEAQIREHQARLQREREEREEKQRQQELLKQQEFQRQQEILKEQQYQRTLELQRLEQQEREQQMQQQQRAADERSPKRKVTIGSEEVHHVKKSVEEGCRIVVYNFDGSVKFKIVGGNKERIYVSDVEPNSEPALNGLLVGDQIVKINGRSTRGRTKEETYGQLVNCGTKVSLVVRERRTKCAEVLEMGGEGDKMFMEASFDHDPAQAGELIVRKGDIFMVKDSLPDGAPGSWKAVKVMGKTAEEQTAWKPLKMSKHEEETPGLIPNIQRAKQIMVKDNLLNNKPTQRGGLFTRSFGRSKSADRSNKAKDAEKRALQEAQMIPYRRVSEVGYDFKRPVMLLGLFCDVVRQQLLHDSPAFFECPEGDLEVPTDMGPVDLQAIKMIMERNKHCLIIMSPRGIEYMKSRTDLSPIVIYLSPVSKNIIKVVKNKLAPDYDKKVNYMYDEAIKFEKQHGGLFTTMVQYTADDTWFQCLKNTIFELQDATFWRPYNPQDDSFDDDDDYGSEEEQPAVEMRGRPAMAAQRMSKTTDDLPDPRPVAPRGRLATQPEDYSQEESTDDFDSDESEEAEVDVGMRRPGLKAGFPAVDPMRPANAPPVQQPQYAHPTRMEAMRARNRSEGDILQYLNSDIENMNPPQQYQGTYAGQPMPPRFSAPQHPQQYGAPRPQYRGPVPRSTGHPGYEYMRPAMNIQRPQQHQYQMPQRPPHVIPVQVTPASNINNRETQL